MANTCCFLYKNKNKNKIHVKNTGSTRSNPTRPEPDFNPIKMTHFDLLPVWPAIQLTRPKLPVLPCLILRPCLDSIWWGYVLEAYWTKMGHHSYEPYSRLCQDFSRSSQPRMTLFCHTHKTKITILSNPFFPSIQIKEL